MCRYRCGISAVLYGSHSSGLTWFWNTEPFGDRRRTGAVWAVYTRVTSTSKNCLSLHGTAILLNGPRMVGIIIDILDTNNFIHRVMLRCVSMEKQYL